MSISAQQRFDETYISSREILERLSVTRPTISSASRRGLLPEAIMINGMHIWEREKAEPYIAAWEKLLNIRRANSPK